MITPTKELIQEMAAVTNSETELSRSAMARLQTDQTPDKANAETHKRDNDKEEDERIAGDSANKRSDPTNSRGDEGSDISENRGNGDRSKATAPFKY